MKSKPSFSKHLFWDINENDLDMEKNKVFIVGRVLDYGLISDWEAIKNYYTVEGLAVIAPKIRTLFPKSLSFISCITGVPKSKFRCYNSKL